MSEAAISTLEGLRAHLQLAIQLEHAMLPPYHCALYSIVPGSDRESVEIIKSAFVEEMLHLALTANVLNTIGRSHVIDDAQFAAPYATSLPNRDHSFFVPRARFAPATIQTFSRIEMPKDSEAPWEADGYETTGQFYRAIEDGPIELCGRDGADAVLCGDLARLVTPEMLNYNGSSRLVVERDLSSTLEAIDEIAEQGEGLKHAEI